MNPREDRGRHGVRECRYCGLSFTTHRNPTQNEHIFFGDTCEFGETGLLIETYVCPGSECRKRSLSIVWTTTEVTNTYERTFVNTEDLRAWRPLPAIQAKPQPDWIPPKIRARYNEACAVLQESPSSSVMQSRACISLLLDARWTDDDPDLSERINNTDSLAKKIRLAQDRLKPEIVTALDAIRLVGNEGAHPSVEVLTDTRREEADLVLAGIEMILKEWERSCDEKEDMKRISVLRDEAEARKDKRTARRAKATKKTT